jgi:cysteinyl-tRNA synthetase
MDDDLDTVTALQVLWKLVRDENAKGKIKTIKEMDKVLGLDLLKKENVEIPDEVLKLLDERNNARAEKNWSKADDLRKKIGKLGFRIDDTGKGSKVQKN